MLTSAITVCFSSRRFPPELKCLSAHALMHIHNTLLKRFVRTKGQCRCWCCGELFRMLLCVGKQCEQELKTAVSLQLRIALLCEGRGVKRCCYCRAESTLSQPLKRKVLLKIAGCGVEIFDSYFPPWKLGTHFLRWETQLPQHRLLWVL